LRCRGLLRQRHDLLRGRRCVLPRRRARPDPPLREGELSLPAALLSYLPIIWGAEARPRVRNAGFNVALCFWLPSGEHRRRPARPFRCRSGLMRNWSVILGFLALALAAAGCPKTECSATKCAENQLCVMNADVARCCEPTGTPCSQGSDSCCQLCTDAGTCACMVTNEPCRTNTDCCMGHCNPNGGPGTCACGSAGASCAFDFDCCSGLCDGGLCECIPSGAGYACNQDSDCCFGPCRDAGAFSACCAASGFPCAAGQTCCGGGSCTAVSGGSPVCQ
jgi:hypothetical protein